MGVKEVRQRIVKKPMAEAVSATKRLKKAGKLTKTGRIREPAPVAGDLKERKKQKSQKKPKRQEEQGS